MLDKRYETYLRYVRPLARRLATVWGRVRVWPWPGICRVLRAALLAAGPLVTVLACQTISLQDGGRAVEWIGSHGAAAVVTWLFLVLAELAIFGLARLGSLSYLLTAVLPIGLTLVSYYKTIINGEPLMLTDFSLAGNIANVASFAMDRITVSPATGTALGWALGLTAALLALDVAVLRHPVPWGLDARRGAALCGGSLLALAAAFAGGLEDFCVARYEAYPMQADRDAGCGVPLSLLSTLVGSQAKGSEAYSELRMQRILQNMEADREQQADEASGPTQKPHIIFVMNESFFDVTRLPGLTFSQDPLPNYHRLAAESTYGPFYTITCGGGTGWVEMETFTGVSMEELDGGTANTELTAAEYEALPSYVRVLDENGYETIAFHAHTSELYNRDKNYPHIGFDQVLFYEEFQENATYEGGYFDDNSTADVIISLFEEYRDTPTYLYAMTMQNHQPYYAGRYDPERLEVESDLLSQKDLEVLNCYVSGLCDADRMLGKLVDYFSAVDEPVILVFTGDHVPGLYLSDTESIYSKLGRVPTSTSAGWSAENYRDMLSTDYLIWTNFSAGEGERPGSATMMGAEILDLAGVDNTPFFSWMEETGRSALTFHYGILTVGPDGELAEEDDGAITEFLSAYGDVIYDILYGEQYIAGRVNQSGG